MFDRNTYYNPVLNAYMLHTCFLSGIRLVLNMYLTGIYLVPTRYLHGYVPGTTGYIACTGYIDNKFRNQSHPQTFIHSTTSLAS